MWGIRWRSGVMMRLLCCGTRGAEVKAMDAVVEIKKGETDHMLRVR